MRIISGKHKGRVIPVPKNIKLRPTTDKAKEGLFNILTNIISYEETKALDLFSGTGSIAFELISRGCPFVDVVEKNRRMANYIRETTKKLQFETINVNNTDAYHYIVKSTIKYDLIFADPPYEMKGIEKLPEIIFEYGCLNNNGIFILEHSKNHQFMDNSNFMDTRNYGHVCFSFFKNKTPKV